MHCCKALVLVAASLFMGVAVAGEAPGPDELVRQLGSNDFDERQDALAKLEALGDAARGALEKARRSDVLEIRSSAYRLLAKLKHAKLILKIVDEHGKPRAGESLTDTLSSYGQYGQRRDVQLLGFARAGNQNKSIETDKDGCIRLESPGAGPHSLYLRWGNSYRPSSMWLPTMLDLRSGENRAFWVRAKGATVKGRVLSIETEEPVSDAEILVRPDTGAGLRQVMADWQLVSRTGQGHQGSSGDGGTFSVEGVSPAVMRVFVRHADLAPAVSEPITISKSGEYTLDEPLRLKPKSEVWGRVRFQVLGSDAKPVENAKVRIQLVPLAAEEKDAQQLLQRHFANRRQAQPLEADKDGWAQTEWTTPGTYRLVVTRSDVSYDDASRVVSYDEVRVSAGETVVVEAKKAAEYGTLKGRFKADKSRGSSYVRVYAMRMDDPLVSKVLESASQLQSWMIHQIMSDNRSQCYLHGNREGYEIKRLRPGEYVLVMQSMHEQRFGWVFGVKVKPGKTTTVPAIDLTANKKPDEESKLKALKGVVLGRGGKHISRVNYKLSGLGYSSSSSTNGKNFHINLRNNRNPTKLTFTCAGYRPYTIDLSKPIKDPEQLTIQMAPQGYGSVAVTVRDPEGRPLEDVQVAPISAVRKLPSLNRARDTDMEGRADLSGLAYGRRKIVATMEGYWLKEAAVVDVELNKKVNVNLTLIPGKTVKGRVRLPKGVKVVDGLAWIAGTGQSANYGRQSFWRSTAIDEEGRFAFSGMAPGKAKLRAQAPGLVSEEVETVIGSGDPVKLRLVKPSGLIVNLGEEAKGGNVWMVRSGAWAPSRNFYGLLRNSTPVSPTGQAVFGNIASGTYDLIFSKRRVRNIHADRKASMQLIASSLKVSEGDDPLTRKVSWQPGTASVRLTPDSDESGQPRVQRALLLLSDRAFALINSSGRGHFNQHKPWFIRGTPPEGFTAKEEEKGILVTGLPAGEYKLSICPSQDLYGSAYVTRRGQRAPAEPKILKTFSLKKDESLDLGVVELEPLEKPEPEEALSGQEIGEDKPLE